MEKASKTVHKTNQQNRVIKKLLLKTCLWPKGEEKKNSIEYETKANISRNVPYWLLANQYKLRSHFSTKVLATCDEAIKASKIKNGDTLLAGGFGVSGSPIGLAHAIANTGVRDLTVVSNNCGLDKWGLGMLLNRKQIKRMMSSLRIFFFFKKKGGKVIVANVFMEYKQLYVGENKEFARQYLSGELEVEFVPQGTLAERLRAGGAGIPAFYTPTGVGTWIHTGKVPIKYDSKGEVEIYSTHKETRDFNGRTYLLEEAITGAVGIVKCHQADPFGNCTFRGTARNFNPECAQAAQFTIVDAKN
ncbi:hypothetical protein RFI_01499 [Reticulomyxa filosa]|uniref:Uncharacterized protein n=1 Tax=Reticulomyxa filosa TaxID=46433 RepID=X6PAK3_RETFI|nr:hypothetical protein RFI_01499 [Reticulomyxa filosa]|eukprot:ETO35565.1 hypothetical protein RFI_01499 [Reticulomyxa filosa]